MTGKTGPALIFSLFLLASFGFSSSLPAQKLKVFISVDMEGISGVISGEETGKEGKDYGLFRQLMTEEANAAIEGALEAGATEVVVRDAHGSALNILPNLLHPEAFLIREWSQGPLDMMEGLDQTFAAVFFIGYHAQAGTPDAVLKHTIAGTIYDLKLNGKIVPEAGLNAAIAGYFGVPVALVTGDLAVTLQAKEILGEVSTVAVKEGIGKAGKMIHPEKAKKLIKAAAVDALKNLAKCKPFKLTSPVTMEISFTREDLAAKAAWIPGARRTGNRSVAFTHNDFLEVLRFYLFAVG
ncbi:MAG: M55 family metallopeptidase [Acidobacteriota bacterium]